MCLLLLHTNTHTHDYVLLPIIHEAKATSDIMKANPFDTAPPFPWLALRSARSDHTSVHHVTASFFANVVQAIARATIGESG